MSNRKRKSAKVEQRYDDKHAFQAAVNIAALAIAKKG